MAMNNMGMGYAFTGKDTNLSKTAIGIKEQILGIDKSIMGLNNSASQSNLGDLLGGIKLPDIGRIGSGFMAIATDTKLAATQIEEMEASTRKVFKANTVGMSSIASSGKDLAEVQSIVYNTGLGAEAVTDNLVGLRQANIDFKKSLGFESLSDYSKALNVLGVDGKEFAGVVGNLQNQFKLSAGDTKELFDGVTGLATSADMGKEGIAALIKQERVLSETHGVLLKKFAPKEIKNTFLELTNVAGAVKGITGNAQRGADAASELFNNSQALVKNQKEFFAGIGGLGEGSEILLQELGGNIEDVVSNFEKKPAQMTLSIAKFYQKQKKVAAAAGKDISEQSQRSVLQLSKVYGPDVANFMINASDEMIAKLESANKSITDPGAIAGRNGGFEKIKKGHDDGRTAATKFTMAQDRFQKQLKKAAGLNDWEYLAKYKAGVQEAVAITKKLAADKGPLGKLTEKLVEVKNYGFGGMITQINPTAGAFLALGESFGPIIQMAPGIVAAFGAIFSPLTLVAGAIALFVAYTEDMTIAGIKARPMIEKLGQKVKEFAQRFGAFAKEAIPRVIKAIREYAPKIAEALKQVDWKAIFTPIGGLLRDALVGALSLAGEAAKWFVAFLKGVDWAAVMSFVVEKLGMLLDMLIPVVGQALEVLKTMLVAAVTALGPLIVPVIWGITKLIWKAFVAAAGAIIDTFGNLSDWVIDKFGVLGYVVAAGIKVIEVAVITSLGLMIASYLRLQATALMVWLAESAQFLKSNAVWLVAWGTRVIAFITGNAAMGAASATFAAIMGSTAATAAVAWTAILGPLALVVIAIGLIIAAVILVIKYWDQIVQFGKYCWETILVGVNAVWWALKKVGDFLGWIGDKFKSLGGWIKKVLGIGTTEAKQINPVMNSIESNTKKTNAEIKKISGNFREASDRAQEHQTIVNKTSYARLAGEAGEIVDEWEKVVKAVEAANAAGDKDSFSKNIDEMEKNHKAAMAKYAIGAAQVKNIRDTIAGHFETVSMEVTKGMGDAEAGAIRLKLKVIADAADQEIFENQKMVKAKIINQTQANAMMVGIEKKLIADMRKINQKEEVIEQKTSKRRVRRRAHQAKDVSKAVQKAAKDAVKTSLSPATTSTSTDVKVKTSLSPAAAKVGEKATQAAINTGDTLKDAINNPAWARDGGTILTALRQINDSISRMGGGRPSGGSSRNPVDPNAHGDKQAIAGG